MCLATICKYDAMLNHLLNEKHLNTCSLREQEGNQVTEMHGPRRGPPAGVQVERLLLLDVAEDGVHIAVREEDASPEQMVRRRSADALHPGEQVRVDLGAAKAL